MIWNICGRFFSGKCCCFSEFLEHSPEFFLRKMLLDWPFFGTFAGVFSPENVAGLAVFWNICRSFFSGKCCCFSEFLEHSPEFFLRKMLLDWPFFGTFAGDFSPGFALTTCRSAPNARKLSHIWRAWFSVIAA